jgi:ketosteroid isomerase-like protein
VSTESDVRKASEQFYAALNSMLNGDSGPLAAIWSHGAAVSTMHPIGGRQLGWDEVRGSWEQVARVASAGRVTLDQQVLHVGSDIAYELGVERGDFMLAGQQVSGLAVRVTNIYRREEDGWKVVHHHTDVSQAMVDILSRSQRKP